MQGAASPLTGAWGCAPAIPHPRAAAGGEATGNLTEQYARSAHILQIL